MVLGRRSVSGRLRQDGLTKGARRDSDPRVCVITNKRLGNQEPRVHITLGGTAEHLFAGKDTFVSTIRSLGIRVDDLPGFRWVKDGGALAGVFNVAKFIVAATQEEVVKVAGVIRPLQRHFFGATERKILREKAL
ncbi:MAG: hypothetical protein UT86_C0001G0072 [Candidatus Magasanikbacteria bacterium GW2011_GWC2_40_17]|uniref:Uncharacterized protein n=1 Tax=Candidatus Magasanikbacteria bacterium GW2011_GWA2_42_32 TaxID=1619039 RepID=A0A0G1A8R3_9BACT|nr:MAG: hypothetical protein UT86_C0001G0072 [Candidatus Magasanikbacteria bacterium GW2011_GWC2_40_17]KKS57432.1 MAG: hypothetical protein UV20_C0001G0072 [Candidatus Magasanikbacteria bacterium GW2011_GWA2_42_32]OGH85576.1 MAG: hypothetical protein A2294_01700 [Candidatus Magasanikbacteria bacterium RIFOXYB2_FULL_38_10]